MATDARRTCPVCAEPLDDRPQQCFRCETPLGAWWTFEEEARATRAPGPTRRRHFLPIALAGIVGAALAGLWSPLSAPTRPSPAPSVVPSPTPPPAPAVAPVLRYRVQRGDTLWRIAAAVTGDGRNWRSLWPTRDGNEPLAVGEVLELPMARENQ